MLKLSANSYSALADRAKADWLEHAVRTIRGRHPAWSANRTESDLRDLCLRLDNLSAYYDLNHQHNFEALVDLVVETAVSLELNAFQRYLMSRPGFTEDTAVKLLCADVRRGSRIRMLEPDDLGFNLPPEEQRA